MISLLSIKKAEIPKQQNLSVDTSIILNAINDLRNRSNNKIEDTYVINNEKISIGDEIMYSHDGAAFHFGTLINVTQNNIS